MRWQFVSEAQCALPKTNVYAVVHLPCFAVELAELICIPTELKEWILSASNISVAIYLDEYTYFRE